MTTGAKVKPKVAFFDFTSCEGCQLNKLNLEDDLLRCFTTYRYCRIS